jgi:hypothetical protein
MLLYSWIIDILGLENNLDVTIWLDNIVVTLGIDNNPDVIIWLDNNIDVIILVNDTGFSAYGFLSSG